MIVLVVPGEKTLRVHFGQAEGGKRNWPAKFAGKGAVETNQFRQGHEGSAASGFGAHEFLLRQSVLREDKQREDRNEKGIGLLLNSLAKTLTYDGDVREARRNGRESISIISRTTPRGWDQPRLRTSQPWR